MQKWCPYKSLFLSICPSVCLSFRETFEISLCHTSMTWFYSCHRKYIFCHKIYSFFHRKNPSVTDNHTPFVTGGILSFTGRFFKTWVHFIMWHKIFLLLQGVLCASHEGYFRSQEWFFKVPLHKKYLSCETK